MKTILSTGCHNFVRKFKIFTFAFTCDLPTQNFCWNGPVTQEKKKYLLKSSVINFYLTVKAFFILNGHWRNLHTLLMGRLWFFYWKRKSGSHLPDSKEAVQQVSLLLCISVQSCNWVNLAWSLFFRRYTIQRLLLKSSTADGILKTPTITLEYLQSGCEKLGWVCSIEEVHAFFGLEAFFYVIESWKTIKRALWEIQPIFWTKQTVFSMITDLLQTHGT